MEIEARLRQQLKSSSTDQEDKEALDAMDHASRLDQGLRVDHDGEVDHLAGCEVDHLAAPPFAYA